MAVAVAVVLDAPAATPAETRASDGVEARATPCKREEVQLPPPSRHVRKSSSSRKGAAAAAGGSPQSPQSSLSDMLYAWLTSSFSKERLQRPMAAVGAVLQAVVVVVVLPPMVAVFSFNSSNSRWVALHLFQQTTAA